MNTEREMRLVALIQVRGDPRLHLRGVEGTPVCGFKGRGIPTTSSGYLREMTCGACRARR
jgi:hypothetical protein